MRVSLERKCALRCAQIFPRCTFWETSGKAPQKAWGRFKTCACRSCTKPFENADLLACMVLLQDPLRHSPLPVHASAHGLQAFFLFSGFLVFVLEAHISLNSGNAKWKGVCVMMFRSSLMRMCTCRCSCARVTPSSFAYSIAVPCPACSPSQGFYSKGLHSPVREGRRHAEARLSLGFSLPVPATVWFGMRCTSNKSCNNVLYDDAFNFRLAQQRNKCNTMGKERHQVLVCEGEPKQMLSGTATSMTATSTTLSTRSGQDILCARTSHRHGSGTLENSARKQLEVTAP